MEDLIIVVLEELEEDLNKLLPKRDSVTKTSSIESNNPEGKGSQYPQIQEERHGQRRVRFAEVLQEVCFHDPNDPPQTVVESLRATSQERSVSFPLTFKGI